jgi:hypothetical protein
MYALQTPPQRETLEMLEADATNGSAEPVGKYPVPPHGFPGSDYTLPTSLPPMPSLFPATTLSLYRKLGFSL